MGGSAPVALRAPPPGYLKNEDGISVIPTSLVSKYPGGLGAEPPTADRPAGAVR